jgi:hypothetical protein
MPLERRRSVPHARARLFTFLPNLYDFNGQNPEANGTKNDLKHFPALLFGVPRGDRICHIL